MEIFRRHKSLLMHNRSPKYVALFIYFNSFLNLFSTIFPQTPIGKTSKDIYI